MEKENWVEARMEELRELEHKMEKEEKDVRYWKEKYESTKEKLDGLRFEYQEEMKKIGELLNKAK